MTLCVNSSCPAQFERLLQHFASRGAMDIEGLGERVSQDLARNGLVKDLAEVFSLAEKRTELLELEKMGEKRVDNLLQAIESAKTRPLPQASLRPRHHWCWLGGRRVALQAVPVTDGHRGSDGRGADRNRRHRTGACRNHLGVGLKPQQPRPAVATARRRGEPGRRHARAAGRPPVCRQDRGRDGPAGFDVAAGGSVEDQVARREGVEQRVEEDGLPGRRGRCRVKTRYGRDGWACRCSTKNSSSAF